MNIDFMALGTDVEINFRYGEYPDVHITMFGKLTKSLEDADIVGLAEFKAKLRDFIRAEIVKHIRPAGEKGIGQS